MAILQKRSIKSLYPLALAEGEGVGTAYEYFAKRLILGRWLKNRAKPSSMLVAGLPEKYGCSLDFFLLAHEWDIRPIVVDQRRTALEKLARSIAAAQQVGDLSGLEVDLLLVNDIVELNEVHGQFDLAICSEVLQGISAENRPNYLNRLNQLATQTATFCPNADNAAHTNLSGLSGLTLNEIQALSALPSTRSPQPSALTGYIDMPPFPPGITRDEDQREHASSGKLEAFAMWGLGYYARAESLMPSSVRRSQSHIVYAFFGR
jgi:hypothetical protein